jgi:hypothetical protein
MPGLISIRRLETAVVVGIGLSFAAWPASPAAGTSVAQSTVTLAVIGAGSVATLTPGEATSDAPGGPLVGDCSSTVGMLGTPAEQYTCKVSYADRTFVTIEAIADAGQTVSGWSRPDCPQVQSGQTTAICTIPAVGQQLVVAKFTGWRLRVLPRPVLAFIPGAIREAETTTSPPDPSRSLACPPKCTASFLSVPTQTHVKLTVPASAPNDNAAFQGFQFYGIPSPCPSDAQPPAYTCEVPGGEDVTISYSYVGEPVFAAAALPDYLTVKVGGTAAGTVSFTDNNRSQECPNRTAKGSCGFPTSTPNISLTPTPARSSDAIKWTAPPQCVHLPNPLKNPCPAATNAGDGGASVCFGGPVKGATVTVQRAPHTTRTLQVTLTQRPLDVKAFVTLVGVSTPHPVALRTTPTVYALRLPAGYTKATARISVVFQDQAQCVTGAVTTPPFNLKK